MGIHVERTGTEARRRGVTLSRPVAAIVALGLVGATVWAGAATWFILNRDEIAARALAREADLQFAYEAKLTALRTQIDRIASRQLINQDGVDERLDQLASRQAQIETRQALIADLARAVRPVAAAASANAESAAIAEPPKPVIRSERPVPLIGGDKPMPAVDLPPLRGMNRTPKGASLFGDSLGGGQPRYVALPARPASLDAIGAALGRIEADQVAVVRAVMARTREEAANLRAVLAETGLPMAFAREVAGGVGGPFIPLPGKGGPFETMLEDARAALTEYAILNRAVAALPLARPIEGEIDLTSGFGYRLDPFTRTPAMHSGIDFRGETGTPVRATAGGTVITADWSGGYGRLVEIDHGNGLTTRYGHLASIAVSAGDKVEAGALIGRVGASGRATGPHLHYETRIDDSPVDPTRFLRAGMRLRQETSALN